MGGHKPVQNFIMPYFFMPAPITVPKAIRAKALVTAKSPVGDPVQGSKPSRLQNKIKKNKVQMNGRKRSAS